MASDQTLRNVGQVTPDKEGKPDLKVLNEQLRQIWMALHSLAGRSGPVTTLDSEEIQGDLVVDGLIGAGGTPTGVLHAYIPIEVFPDAGVPEPINVGNPWRSGLVIEAPDAFVDDPVGGSRIQIYPVLHMITTNPTTGKRQKLLRFAAANNSWAITGLGLSGTGNDATLRCNYAGASTVWGLGSTIDSNFFLKVGGSITSTPVAGNWYKTSSTAGLGNYGWDTENKNTGATYFTRSTTTVANDTINIVQAGTYMVMFQTIATTTGNGTITIARSGTTISSGGLAAIGRTTHFSFVGDFTAGQTIIATLATAGDRGGDANGGTQLSIVRLV